MLIGRETELERQSALVDAAARGGSSSLMVLGAPGIGKTAMLKETCSAAGDVTVLDANGVEAESELPFAGLVDLLGPLESRIDALPPPQAAALAGALALGPAVPGDRLAVSVATLGLLRATGADGPVLVALDDVHWLDISSLHAVLYAARRQPAGVSFLLMARELEGHPIDRRGIDAMTLKPLPGDDAAALLDRVAPDLSPAARQAVAETAAGNPLALEQLPSFLSEEALRQRTWVQEPLPPGEALEAAFASRAEALPDGARDALLLAAACNSSDLRPLLAAGVSTQDLVLCERTGLIVLDGDRLAFLHPLVRAAVYHRADAEERRRAHARLAQTELGARPWHLAAAAVGPDEEAAEALALAGIGAASRRAPAEAAHAFERAARLTPDPVIAFDRLLTAGSFALASGHSAMATGLLEEATRKAPDALSRGRVDNVRGLMLFFGAKVSEAIAVLERGGLAMAEASPEEAAVLFAEAAMASTVAGDFPRALGLAGRAVALTDRLTEGLPRALALANDCWARFLSGEGRAIKDQLAEADRLAAEVDPYSPEATLLHFALNMRLPAEEFPALRARIGEQITVAEEAGVLMALPMLRTIAGELDYRMGDWEDLDEAFEAVAELGLETGLTGAVAFSLVNRARLAAAQGRADDCEALTEAALAIGVESGGGGMAIYSYGARGFAALGAGAIDRAIRDLERTEQEARLAGYREPTVVPWRADLVEAYARHGDQAAAHRISAGLDDEAELADTHLGAAMAARCRGILAGDGFEECFEEALGHHDHVAASFERARTDLSYGERLHRARRRVEARERLRAALSTFEELGAAPWAARASDELGSTGARRDPDHGDLLTSAELRVALAAAEGLTTKEVAAQLFLSPKTVEFHLSRVYRKLGIQSRGGLAKALARQGALTLEDS